MSSAHAHSHTDSAIRHLRRKRQQFVQRRRRQRLLGATAAVAVALGSVIGVATLTGTDLAGAATARAASLMDLFAKRSPGERTEAQLTKTKSRHKLLAERAALAPAPVTVDLADFIAPPPSIVPVEIGAAPLPMDFFAPPPPAILLPPPGGGGGPPGGGPPGGGPPQTPPGPPTIIVPAVPEPSTWMTMLFGFAFMGWMLRRQKRPACAVAR